MGDFTHQLLDRDYMLQSFIEGERWDTIRQGLTDEQNNHLWERFGSILRQIHDVQGKSFGLPLTGLLFSNWIQCVIERLERALQTAQTDRLEIPYLSAILEFVRFHPQQLEEFQTPRLLHGDLWSFNILVKREGERPSIVGILDADRSWSGDPLADWTMLVLAHSDPEEGHSRFWQACGRRKHLAPGFRVNVYDAMHAATAFVWASRRKDKETISRPRATLGHVGQNRQSL